MIAKADIVTCTIKDCRNKPSKGPKSIAISVSSIVSNAEASMAVFPDMIPALAFITCCATSNTAIVILNVFEIRVTARKVLKTHLKNVHVSKFARLLCSMSIWISS